MRKAREFLALTIQTSMSGKWHLTRKPYCIHPADRGFDDFYGILSGAASYFAPATLRRNRTNAEAEAHADPDFHLTSSITRAWSRATRSFIVPLRLPARSLATMIALAAGAGADGDQFIEAYTHRHSFETGDTIRFCVSTDSPTYELAILRDSGFERSVLDRVEDLAGREQPVPDEQAWRGARWDTSHGMVVPPTWPTGSYLVRLRTEDQTEHYHPFVIRASEPGSKARVVFVSNDATRQAYNDWGGKSFYRSDVPQDPTPAHHVSFERPYTVADGQTNARVVAFIHGWLEQAGFDLEYLTEWDIHQNPCVLRAYDVVIFAGHHEYVSRRVYDAVEAHQERGGHLIFFSANDLFWQVRYEDDGRMLAGYKGRAHDEDPFRDLHPCLLTALWSDAVLDRPGEAITGVTVSERSWNYEHADYLVKAPSHWIFEGTGLEHGDAFGSLVASGEQDYLGAASPDVDVVLYAFKDVPRDPFARPADGVPVCAVYFEKGPAYGFPNGQGGAVFSAGTIFGWATGLLEQRGPGWEDVRRATENIVAHMLDHPPAPPPGRDCPFLVSCFFTQGDFDDDGVIGIDDLLILLSTWGPCDDCVSDIDNDGTVTMTDLLALLSHFDR